MRLPQSPLSTALQQRAAAMLAAAMLAASPMTAPPAAFAASTLPTPAELSRLPAGLARIDMLLDNWDKITTVCNGVLSEDELKQVTTFQSQKCNKSPLAVQKYIGAASTLDPLFKADKLMIRATPLVAENDAEAYSNAVDAYITKQQMSSTMAYTSSWSGIENPNGNNQAIEDALLEAKKEVVELRSSVAAVVELLKLEKF